MAMPLLKVVGKVRRAVNKRFALSRLQPADQQLIARLRTAKLTYLLDEKLASLVATVRALETRRAPGIFIEAGCALGGSAILIGTLKTPEREFRVYDTFGMIPPPTAEDTQDVHDRYKAIVAGESEGIDGDPYYGYMSNLQEVVRQNLANFAVDTTHIALIKGLLQDTMTVDGPVAFAHVDVDWYDPVRTCLERIFPRLIPGGSIILDDYHDWGGCRKATDEFLRTVAGQFTLDDSAVSMKITKR